MFLSNEINELYNNFSNKVYDEKVLNKKTKELIALACSVMADCVPCVNYHYKKAAEAGASQEEIAEVMAIALTICAGSKRAKYAGQIENLEKELR